MRAYLLFALTFSTVTFSEPIPGDFEPQVKWVCHCSCGALGMSRQIRAWDNVRRVYYYVWTGVPLYEYDELGENYGFKVPVAKETSCRYVDGRGCTGLLRRTVSSQPERLEGRYSNCRKEAVFE